MMRYRKQSSANRRGVALTLDGSSDFIWPFLRPYMGVIPNPKMAFIFPISCILALISPILINIFPNVKEKVAS